MELEITSKHENLLLNRIELNFKATHPGEATPKRDELRQQIAKELSAKKELVILDWERSDYGRTVTVGYAKVYKSKEDVMRIERKPILVRMGLVAAEVREKKERKVAPPAKKEEAKPAEKAPAKAEEAKAAKKEEPPKKEAAAKPAEKPKEEKAAPAKKEEPKPEAKKPAKGGK